MNIAIHFEIPVQDLERAIRFYEGVFETVLERVQIDGNEMALFPWKVARRAAPAPWRRGELCAESGWHPDLSAGARYRGGHGPGTGIGRGLPLSRHLGRGGPPGGGVSGLRGESHRLAGGDLTIIYPVHGMC